MTYVFPYVGSEQFEAEYRLRSLNFTRPKTARKRPTQKQAAVMQALSEYSDNPMPPSLKKILYEVARAHNLSIPELVGSARPRYKVSARREFVYRARKETNKSFPQIGRAIGRDHTTAIHLFQTYDEGLDGLSVKR
jgi:chromosomal replication initiation ATPase DnaA